MQKTSFSFKLKTNFFCSNKAELIQLLLCVWNKCPSVNIVTFKLENSRSPSVCMCVHVTVQFFSVCVCMCAPQSGSVLLGCRLLSDRSCFWTERWCGPSGRSGQESHRRDGSSPPAHCSRSPVHVNTHTHTLWRQVYGCPESPTEFIWLQQEDLKD